MKNTLSWLPKHLQIDDILIHSLIDEKIHLFTCRNLKDELYLVLLISTYGKDYLDKAYFIISISSNRYYQLLIGEIDLTNVFKYTESGVLLELSEEGGKIINIHRVPSGSTANDLYLPSPGTYLTDSLIH